MRKVKSAFLFQTAKNCLKKTVLAVKTNGQLDNAANVAQLDSTAELACSVSPLVDDFVSGLYPPMSHAVCEEKVHFKGPQECTEFGRALLFAFR